MRDDRTPTTGVRQLLYTLMSALIVSAALVGFFVGVTFERGVARPAADNVMVESSDAPPAVVYSEQPAARLSPNKEWTNKLSNLRFPKPGIFDTVVRTEDRKQQALADRASRRAYEGAPPVIPHPIGQQEAANCLACHGAGLWVEDRLATPISHPPYANCTQCHIAAGPMDSIVGSQPATNDFVGVYRAGKGERAWPGAPPTIPHSTWMRNECLSCHGLVARPGIRTTHPWRSSCTQCHVSSATVDQVDFFAATEATEVRGK